ncbi:MAG: hypothetical protein R3E39_30380 [Anaerolineae bacterium]
MRLSLSGLEAGDLPRRRTVVQVPETFVLNIEDIVKARQGGDNVAVLLIEMLESGILMEDIHALPLRKDHPDRAVLEHQPRFPLQKDRHLLVQPQLNRVLRQPLI